MALATSVASAVAAHMHSPFLDGLSAEELRVVLTAASERRLLANSVVLHANTPADLFFLLTSGLARHFLITPEGQKVLLLWLSPGSVFGARALLHMESTYLVSTETVKDSRALVWDRQTIRDLMKRYPRLLDNSLVIASDYLTWCSAAHISMVCHDARQRFADVLVTLANGLGR